MTINENLISLFKIKSKMVWSLIRIEYSCLITFFCAGAFLIQTVKGMSPTFPPSPPPLSPPSLPFNLNSISEERKVSMQSANIKEIIQQYWSFSHCAMVLSYFSTAIILYQHVYLISARSMKKRFGHLDNLLTYF